jgi:hypothetical protein
MQVLARSSLKRHSGAVARLLMKKKKRQLVFQKINFTPNCRMRGPALAVGVPKALTPTVLAS